MGGRKRFAFGEVRIARRDRRLKPFEQAPDVGAHRTEETVGIDPHPQDRRRDRCEQPHLARIEVGHRRGIGQPDRDYYLDTTEKGVAIQTKYKEYLAFLLGEAGYSDAAAMADLDRRELWLLAPIAAAVLWMGVYPESFLRPMRADVGRLLERLEPSVPPSDAHLTKGKAARAPHHAPAESH